MDKEGQHPYFEPIEVEGFTELASPTKVYACDICGAMVGAERRADHSDWHARLQRGIRAAGDTRIFAPEIEEVAPRPDVDEAEGPSS